MEENPRRIEDWSARAKGEGAQFVLFTEECITGSLNKSDLNLVEARQIAAEAMAKGVPRLEAFCRRMHLTLIVGTIEPARERLRNCALVVGPEGYLTTFSKLHLPNANEREWFVPGHVLPVIASQGWKFGVGICYDVRFPEIFRVAARQGAEFFLLAVGGSGAAERVDADGGSGSGRSITGKRLCN